MSYRSHTNTFGGPAEGEPRPTQQRQTRQRRAIEDALRASSAFKSAQELHAVLRARGESVGLTTVYNQLRSLADSGEVDALRAEDGEVLYRKCSQASHHHHLVCRRCGRTVEVDVPEIESWATKVANAEGFRDPSHTLEILGTCGGCSALS